MATGRRSDGATVVRLPVDADRPVLNATLLALVLGVGTVVFAVSDRDGLHAPVAVGLVAGVAVAVVAGVGTHAALRRRTRGHRLVGDDDGLAFTVAGDERWRIAWDDVRGAQIVDTTLTYAGRNAPSFCTFLVLDLDPARAPRHGSLHRHEDRWWFSLPRAADRAPLVQRELQRRIPGRVDRPAHQDRVPHRLAVREDTPGRFLR